MYAGNYTALYYHIVFSTKGRKPLLTPNVQQRQRLEHYCYSIIIFLSYFSLGSKEGLMEIYHSNPLEVTLIKGSVSFVITSFVTSLAMLLLAIIKRILLNVKTTREKLFTSLLLIVIIIEIIGVLTYKLITNGYI